MAQEMTRPAPANFLLPGAAGLLALGIFAFDTLSPLGMAAAVLYSVVVLFSASFLQWRGVLLVALACMALAICSYFLEHGESFNREPFARLFVSLLAIGVTAFLAAKKQSAVTVVYEQARLLDLTHDTIFVRDMNDVITYWNRGAEELYGWTATEALGKVSHQLMRTVFAPPLVEINADLLSAGRWEGELIHTKRDGQRLVIASRWSLQRDHRGRPVAVLETNNDITDKKHAEDALRQSEQRFRDYAETASDWLWETGTDHRFIRVSEDRSSVGLNPALRLGATRWDGAADLAEEPEKWRLHVATLRAHEAFRGFEYRTTRDDGSALFIAASGKPVFNQAGEFMGYRGVSSDITSAVRAEHAEDALHRTQMELAHVTRVATLGELAASIAHEVNQPLAAIVTNGEISLRLLDREVPDLPEIREALAAMISSGRRASEIISRLRALAHRTETQKVPLDLNEIVGEIIPLVQQEILRYQISHRFELAPALPMVMGDRVQIQQVMINLVINAIEAMATVADRPRELVIESRSNDAGQVQMAVQDSGIGIDPDKADMLFDAFFTTKSKGMGMGLSISRSILENHGGTLQASRNAGPGATFRFTLRSRQEAGS